MDLSINQSYLCQQLIEINKKYESCTFVDIDFIDLYGLQNQQHNTDIDVDLNIIKKKIVTKYYGLALKYHPDKYATNEEEIINIKNCFVKTEEIKNGQFLAFINDIQQLLLNLITEEPESLINIIKGKTEDVLNKYDLSADHDTLKRRFQNQNVNVGPATEEQVRQFEEEMKRSLIVDAKMGKDEMETKATEEITKRDEFKVEEAFTEEQLTKLKECDQINMEEFNSVFNSAFENHKDGIINGLNDHNGTDNFEQMFSPSNDIQPYNFNSGQTTLAYGSLSNTISELSEAFGPIKINRQPTQQLTFEQMMAQRKEQDEIFKNAKQSKSNNNNC
jgi:curved DNA-binding protein CbpA